jgi:hypothetical protein
MKNVLSGGCQCDQIRYEVSGKPIKVFACHCSLCQKQSGSAFGMSVVYWLKSFEVSKGHLSSFIRDGKGQKVRNYFCSNCGTRIAHHWFTDDGERPTISIKAGTLDETNWLKPGCHVWTQNSQPWITFGEGETIFETQPNDLNQMPDWLD